MVLRTTRDNELLYTDSRALDRFLYIGIGTFLVFDSQSRWSRSRTIFHFSTCFQIRWGDDGLSSETEHFLQLVWNAGKGSALSLCLHLCHSQVCTQGKRGYLLRVHAQPLQN